MDSTKNNTNHRKFQLIPNNSKRIQGIPNDYKELANDYDYLEFQAITRECKEFQQNPRNSTGESQYKFSYTESKAF